ncbi:MAG: glycoside hydrolase family 3 N-terminal domain-containing protein [Thermoanaerobaculia bacterium]
MSGRGDSSRRAAGAVLGIGLTGTRLTDVERRVLEECAPFAVVLFARNVESAPQLHDLIGAVRAAAPRPPLFMIDEEGGRVDRLRALVPGIPGASDFMACGDPEILRAFGVAIGRLLDHFSIEVNLAPVVDLWRDGLSPSLARRCFGNDPEMVALRSAQFIEGMAEAGVASCIKHFPGLGLSGTDPHYGASVVDMTLADLEALDLMPYRRLASLAPSVMVSHGVYPRIDPSGLPGTLSVAISTTLLRQSIGYEGLAITDDMEMHAVSGLAPAGEIAVRSVAAGNDLVLFCSRVEEAPAICAALDQAASADGDFTARLDEAASRGERFVAECARLQSSKTHVRDSFERVSAAMNEFAGRMALEADDDRGRGGGDGRQEWT